MYDIVCFVIRRVIKEKIRGLENKEAERKREGEMEKGVYIEREGRKVERESVGGREGCIEAVKLNKVTLTLHKLLNITC